MAAGTAPSSLPRWAVLVRPRFKFERDRREPVPLEEEESWLRTRSYHAASRCIDRCADEAFRQHSASVVAVLSELSSLLEETTPPPREEASGEEKESPSKRQRTAPDPSEDPLLSRFIMEPPRRYDPLLLPVLTLEGPFHRLDRQAWMQHLVCTTQRSRPRSCVVWLPSLAKVHAELTRQVLQQDADDMVLHSKKKKLQQQSSWTDLLLHWAENTATYDDLCIFLEVEDESFYGRQLQEFVHWLAELRACHGLPCSLVTMGPQPGRRPVLLTSAAQGSVGLLTRTAHLPTSEGILDSFWERLWIQRNCPIPLPSNLCEIAQAFRNQTRSAVSTILLIKQAVAYSFLPRGSFLGATCVLLPQEADRIRWFLVDEEARKLIAGKSVSKFSLETWLLEHEISRRKAWQVMKLQRLFYQRLGLTEPTLLLQASTALPADRDKAAVESATRRSLIALLARHVRTEQRSLTDDTFPWNEALRNCGAAKTVDAINELIVLLDQCIDAQQIQRCLWEVLEDWVDKPLSPHPESLSRSAPALPRPRTDFVASLSEQEAASSSPLVKMPGLLYNLAEGRISVTRQEWFQAAKESLPECTVLLFACGVNSLKLAGLIREKSSKGDVVYEKTAIVWCSGS